MTKHFGILDGENI